MHRDSVYRLLKEGGGGMRSLLLFLLLPLSAEAALEKQEYCDGYTTIDMRVSVK